MMPIATTATRSGQVLCTRSGAGALLLGVFGLGRAGEVDATPGMRPTPEQASLCAALRRRRGRGVQKRSGRCPAAFSATGRPCAPAPVGDWQAWCSSPCRRLAGVVRQPCRRLGGIVHQPLSATGRRCAPAAARLRVGTRSCARSRIHWSAQAVGTDCAGDLRDDRDWTLGLIGPNGGRADFSVNVAVSWR
jgi:hypothetical protein